MTSTPYGSELNCEFGLVREEILVHAYITLLRTSWGPHRRSFEAKEAEELTGKLNHIAFGAPWLKHHLGNIYSSLAAALRLNKSHLVRTSPCFRDALHKIRTATAPAEGTPKQAFYTGATARSVHGSNTLHHIGTDLRHDPPSLRECCHHRIARHLVP
jgi:hypothetical protein